MKKEIITIAGKLGSGKSSTANRLAEILGFSRASTGDFMRSMATERGTSLEQLGQMALTDPSIDHELDDYTKKVGDQSKIILDARLGFHFIPDSYKVFLELDPIIAAERILKDVTNNPNRTREGIAEFNSVENIVTSNKNRLDTERKRYKELYGIKDQTAHENFDLVIDTGSPEYNNNVEAAAQKIAEGYKHWLSK